MRSTVGDIFSRMHFAAIDMDELLVGENSAKTVSPAATQA